MKFQNAVLNLAAPVLAAEQVIAVDKIAFVALPLFHAVPVLTATVDLQKKVKSLNTKEKANS
jgi:hypothetical protein